MSKCVSITNKYTCMSYMYTMVSTQHSRMVEKFSSQFRNSTLDFSAGHFGHVSFSFALKDTEKTKAFCVSRNFGGWFVHAVQK